MDGITLKVLCKKSDNLAFKGDDGNWYNLNSDVVPFLAKVNKGDKITIEYSKKGVSRYVSKLSGAGEVATKTETTSPTGYVCEVCGKVLKDGKFKKCFTCNKSGATKPAEKSTESSTKKPYVPYDNAEKTAQIQRGNALNAAASVASSQQFADPEVAKQFTLLLAEDFLNWLRAE